MLKSWRISFLYNLFLALAFPSNSFQLVPLCYLLDRVSPFPSQLQSLHVTHVYACDSHACHMTHLQLAQTLGLRRLAHTLQVVDELALLSDGGLQACLLQLVGLAGTPLLTQQLLQLAHLAGQLLHLSRQLHVSGLQLVQLPTLQLDLTSSTQKYIESMSYRATV